MNKKQIIGIDNIFKIILIILLSINIGVALRGFNFHSFIGWLLATIFYLKFGVENEF